MTMEIKVDEKMLEGAINSKINKAVEDAIGGCSVRQAIAEKLTESFAHGVIAQAFDAALNSINVTKLTQHLAEEISRATTRAAVMVLTHGLADTLMSLKRIPSYDTDGQKRARAEILAELKK